MAQPPTSLQETQQATWRFILKLAGFLALILLLVYLLLPRGPSDEEQISDLLDRTARLAGTMNCPAYLEVIDRDPAFTLSYYSTQKRFGADESGKQALLEECQRLSSRFLGVKLLVKTKDIEVDGNQATAQIASVWDFSSLSKGADQGSLSPKGKVLQGFSFRFQKRGDTWHIHEVKALNRGEMVHSVLRNLGEYIKP